MLSFPVRKKIGRYEICSKLGAGGMVEVYLAQDTKLDHKVALKILPPDSAQFIASEFVDGETPRRGPGRQRHRLDASRR